MRRSGRYLFIFYSFSIILFISCSLKKQITRSVRQDLLESTPLKTAHVGISIYEPAGNRQWFDYQADHYFVPASNTKIPTCYAAMKYIGARLPGIHYEENDSAIFIFPAADPSLLHPDYPEQPVIRFLQQSRKHLYITDRTWQSTALGSGWSWDDYNEPYMAERSAFPVYGNLVTWIQEKNSENGNVFIYSVPEVNWETNFSADTFFHRFLVERDRSTNRFTLTEGNEKSAQQSVPFVTNGILSALELLKDTIHQNLVALLPGASGLRLDKSGIQTIYTQPTDSVLRKMMHHSDNFFAEELLLMASNERLGFMKEEAIIDTLLKNDLKELPQRPRWVDGSGLSRYNLFTPHDFVTILNKMKTEFGMDRIRAIFPTGNSGTLVDYYQADSNYIFAKTGTLSGVVALSGFLYTKKEKLLIFSILVNNHQASARELRRLIEKFLKQLRNKY